MERQEFIAKARKRGSSDLAIQSTLELYDEYAATDTPLNFDFLLEGMPSESELEMTFAGPSAS